MSIWGDIRKKSLGQETRLEDATLEVASLTEQIAVLQAELKRMTYINKNLTRDWKNLRRDMDDLRGSYFIDRI